MIRSTSMKWCILLTLSVVSLGQVSNAQQKINQILCKNSDSTVLLDLDLRNNTNTLTILPNENPSSGRAVYFTKYTNSLGLVKLAGQETKYQIKGINYMVSSEIQPQEAEVTIDVGTKSIKLKEIKTSSKKSGAIKDGRYVDTVTTVYSIKCAELLIN